MTSNLFLKFEPAIDGESQDDIHAGEIEVHGWRWGMRQSGTMHVAGGGGGRKFEVGNLEIIKQTDSATPNLMKHLAAGTHFDKATLYCRKAGGDRLEYLTIEMNKVIIAEFEADGNPANDIPEEVVRLNFAEFITTYDPQDAAGAGAGAITGGWNIETDVESG